jgi:hypothetical protein
MEPPSEPRPSALDRADRLLGCLVWKPLAALLAVFAVASAWLGVRILRETAGIERLAGFGLAIVVAGILGFGAWRSLRRKRFSEGDFDV